MTRLWVLFALTSCTGRVCWFGACVEDADPAAETSDTGDCADAPSWDGFAQPFLTTWCTPCHSSALTEGDRLGAPEGMNFDTWEGAQAWSTLILAATTGEGADMPPAGGPTEEELELLTAWVTCGASGDATPLSACASPQIYSGDVAIASPEEALSLCEGGDLTVSGDLVVAGDTDGALSCVCEVEGNLRIDVSTASAVRLSALSQVGGELSVRSNQDLTDLDFPALVHVGDAIRWIGNPALMSIDVPELEQVEGDLRIADDGVGGHLTLPEVEDVGGALQVLNNPRLEQLSTPRLAHVGDVWRVEENPMLVTIEHTDTLLTVGGDLSLTHNAALTGWVGFTKVESVGGDITLAHNASFTEIDSFHVLEDLVGSVQIDQHAQLERVLGFHALTDLSGSFSVSGAPVLNRVEVLGDVTQIGGDLILEDTYAYRLAGFDALETLEGHLVIRNQPRLQDLDALQQLTFIGGDGRFVNLDTMEALALPIQTLGGLLEVTGNSSLVSIESMPNLEEIHQLTVSSNPSLTGLRGLFTLTRVTGALTFYDNGTLPDLIGLGNLTEVDGDLSLIANNGMTRLRGLDSLTRIGGDLRVQNNLALPSSQVDYLLTQLGEEGVEGEILTD